MGTRLIHGSLSVYTSLQLHLHERNITNHGLILHSPVIRGLITPHGIPICLYIHTKNYVIIWSVPFEPGYAPIETNDKY